MRIGYSVSSARVLALVTLGACGESYDPSLFPPRAEPTELANDEAVESHRARNRDIVQKYSAHFEADKIYEAEGKAPSQCGGTSFKYRLSRKESGMHLNIRVAYSMGASFDERELVEFSATLNKCELAAEEFFSRNGIYLDIESSLVEPPGSFAPDKVVRVLRGRGRDNASELYVEAPDLCDVYTHELGHWLGLPDEYAEEGTCQSAEFSRYDSEPHNIMASRSNELADLYPRDVYALLRNAFPHIRQAKVALNLDVLFAVPKTEERGEDESLLHLIFSKSSLLRPSSERC